KMLLAKAPAKRRANASIARRRAVRRDARSINASSLRPDVEPRPLTCIQGFCENPRYEPQGVCNADAVGGKGHARRADGVAGARPARRAAGYGPGGTGAGIA